MRSVDTVGSGFDHVVTIISVWEGVGHNREKSPHPGDQHGKHHDRRAALGSACRGTMAAQRAW